MGIVTDQHGNRRGSEQAIRIGIPPGLAQHLVTGRGEANEVRDRGTGDKAYGTFTRQIEEFKQPTSSGGFRGGSRRCRMMISTVLAPGGGEPVGRHANDVRAADDPAEEAWAGGHLETVDGLAGEFLDDRFAVFRIFGKGAAEDGFHVGVGFNGPLREGSDVLAKVPGRVCRDFQHPVSSLFRLHRCLTSSAPWSGHHRSAP